MLEMACPQGQMIIKGEMAEMEVEYSMLDI